MTYKKHIADYKRELELRREAQEYYETMHQKRAFSRKVVFYCLILFTLTLIGLKVWDSIK